MNTVNNMLLILSLTIDIWATHLVQSVSVCKDLDIFLFIDSNTIKNNEAGLLNFIDSIVDDGANEHTGFSAVVYGDLDETKFVEDADIILMDAKDSTKIRKKKKKQTFIKNKLDFSSFKSNSNQTKFVSISDAINIVRKTQKNNNGRV
eukprot:311055_1